MKFINGINIKSSVHEKFLQPLTNLMKLNFIIGKSYRFSFYLVGEGWNVRKVEINVGKTKTILF